ncbi:guanine nucleotide binding protein, alpha subunit [Obelidium mucronatum]|nr:guanine nucleotide binding protein, alpha subunit [Obelidium mucronatum]
MGNLCGAQSPSQETSEQRQQNSFIEKQLEAERKALKNIVKLLILGPGESGKSTVLKQFRLIYGTGFSEEDRASFRALIIVNIVQCAKTLVAQMERLQIPYGFEPKAHAEAVLAALATGQIAGLSVGAASVGLGVGAGVRVSAGGGAAPGSDSALHSKAAAARESDFSAAANSARRGTGNSHSHSATNLARRGTGTAAGSSTNLGRRGTQLGSSSSYLQDSSLPRPSHSSIQKKMDPLAMIAQKLYREEGGDKKVGEIAKFVKIIEDSKIGFGYLGEEEIAPEVVEAIQNVWKDPGVQYCFKRANEYQLIDTCPYYLNDLDRFFTPGYVPIDQDILNSRLMTLTISETKFNVDSTLGKLDYRVYDVGGQRSERKKWAAYFEDVTAILFVVAISAYDQVCFEDAETNRLTEALNVFASICNHPMFKKTALVLFLNKTDLLKQKLEQGSLISSHFSDYTLPNDFDNACEYFENKFMELNKYPDKPVYTYFTWATDRTQTERILETMNSVIIELRLKDINLM